MAQEKPQKGKKSILLRLDGDMWNKIAAWAEDDFRSVNGQIEFILHDALKKRAKSQKSQEPQKQE